MTINDIINEVNVEFGNGQSLAVTNAVKQKTSYNKIGEKDENYIKTADIKKMNSSTNTSVANIVDYLKKKGVWEKVALKQDFNTTDLVFQSDGSCVVNFDEGGSIKVPKEIINMNMTDKKAEPTIKDKFKKAILGEDILEEGKPALQRDIMLKAKPFLKKYGIDFDLSNYQNDGYLKAGGYKFWFDDEERDFRTNEPKFAGKGFADIRELLAYALDIKEAEKEHRNTWGLQAYLARSKPNKGYSNNLYKKVVSENTLEEGAYSNGRYEHVQGKKVNKYHPGHANPIYTSDKILNGRKVGVSRYGRILDNDRSAAWDPNPMNAIYRDSSWSHGKEGTGTEYRKGELPNGYMVWSAEDERAKEEAWNKVVEIIKSSVKDNRNVHDVISLWSDGLYHFPKYSKPEYSPFTTRIQQIRAERAVAELNKLLFKKNRIERNNKKYDESRSDRQIKKDARLWKKEDERFNWQHNNGPKPVHTQSKAFRKQANGDIIRKAFADEKAQKEYKERQARREYIKNKREENKKKRWGPEASAKRRERMALREEVLEEDVKQKLAFFIKRKILPYAMATGLISGASAGTGAIMKNTVKNISNTIKVLSANQDKVSVKIGNDTVSYDANKNVLTVNGKSEKVKEEIADDWWDAFPDDTTVEFGNDKIGSDTLQTMKQQNFDIEQQAKPKVPPITKMSVSTEKHYFPY